jgi:TonB family protein
MNPVAEIVLKVSLILLAAIVIAMALRTRSAALRHWVLSVGIVCAFTTPLLMPLAPAWHLPFSLAPDRPAQAGPLAVAADGVVDVSGSIDRPSAHTGTAIRPTQFSARQWLAWTWMAGTTVGLMALLVGLARLSWIRSRARRVHDQKWLLLAEEVGRSLNIRRRVTLLQSDHPSLLFTWGHFRPIVILPRAASEWSFARARIVLCHELAHVRRGDWLSLIAAELLRAAYWFNPLAWMVGKRLRDESERACDDEVMSQGVEGTDYATELLALARILNAQRPAWIAAPAMARRSSLERRVTAMVDTQVNRQPVGRAPRVVIMAMIFVLAVAVGGFTAAAQTFASFSGSVLDQTGNVVTGVALSMTNKQTGQKYQVTSNDIGSFEFVGLTTGEYDLDTLAAGFRSAKSTMTITGRSVRSDVRLEVGTLEETITVVDRGEPRVEGAGPSVRGGRTPEKPACVAKPTGGYIAQPRKIADARPVYPRSGGVPKAVGVVVLDARIGTDGTVVEARGVDPSLDPDLVAAAIEAVKLWRYTPTLLNCIPIEVQMKVTVNFRTE